MRRLAFGVILIALLSWVAWRLIQTPATPPLPGVEADSVGTGLKAARLYFAAPTGDSLIAEAREMPEPQDLHERVAALVGELDRGPTGRGIATLPAGTSVLHVYMDDRGLLTVDLSRSFQQGFRGGASTESMAVASLARTLAANVPETRQIMLVCGGEPLATLGGHLPLDRPIEVSDLP